MVAAPPCPCHLLRVLPSPRDALEGKGPQRRSQTQLGRRLEEVAKAVGGGYCRLQMPLRLALCVKGTVAGHRLGACEGVRGSPPSNASLPSPPRRPRGAIQVKIVDFITTCCQQIHAMMEGLMDGCDAAATAAEIRKSVNALKMADHMLQASSITQAQAGTVSLITSCVTRIGPDAAALTEHLSDRCGRTAPARPAKPKPQTDPEAQSVGSADPILFPPGIVPTQSFQAEQSFQASLPSPRPDPSAQSRAALQE